MCGSARRLDVRRYETVIGPGGRSCRPLVLPESGPPERYIRSVTTVLAGDAAPGRIRPLASYYGARASPLNPPAGIPEIGIFPVFCAGGVFCNEALTHMVKDPKPPRRFVCSRVYPLFINGFSGFPALTSLKRGSRVLI